METNDDKKKRIEEEKKLIEKIFELKDRITPFYNISESDEGKTTVNITPKTIMNCIESAGFKIFQREDDQKDTEYAVEDNHILYLCSFNVVRSFCRAWLERRKQKEKDNIQFYDNIDAMLLSKHKMMSSSLFGQLQIVNYKKQKDTKEYAVKYFKNCKIKVSKDNIEVFKYDKDDEELKDCKELEKHEYVLSSEIIDHDFHILKDEESIDYDIEIFMKHITTSFNEDGSINKELSEKRYNSIYSVYGYLLHNFNCEEIFVWICDEKFSEEKWQAHGQIGKDVFMKAVRHMTNTMKKKGEYIKKDPDKFLYQNVTFDTDIIYFSDMRRDFDPRAFFDDISDGPEKEEKNKRGTVQIDGINRPKMVGTSNYQPYGEGDSFTKRIYVLEVSEYYRKKKIIEDFGHRLYEEWSEEEWNKFFNFSIKAIQDHMKNECLLRSQVIINFKKNKLRYSMSEAVYNYFDEEKSEYLLKIKYISKEDLIEDFQKEENQKSSVNFEKNMIDKLSQYGVFVLNFRGQLSYRDSIVSDNKRKYIFTSSKEEYEKFSKLKAERKPIIL